MVKGVAFSFHFNKTDLLIHSANKLNSSMPEVRRGCGVWDNKKIYNRKRRVDKCESLHQSI